ncbi:MAG: hypothetical protein E6J59_11335 [Deltaproteobacteria bacterium]|nr:MAG: hypothetical protein E6J59_11335 [Deltaproteobacteria bacterium]
MQDRPGATELLEAVRAFLEEEVVPALDGPRQFHARVAANVLAIVGRELAGEEASLLAEWRRLAGLLGRASEPLPRLEALRAAVRDGTAALAERIRRGDADAGPFRHALRAHVRATVEDKLRVANPRLLESAGGTTR